MSTSTRSPRRYYLLSYPRTASNLLVKILALDSQPNISTGDFDGGYFFLPVDNILCEPGLRNRCVDDWTAKEKAQVQESFQACFDTMQKWLESTESRGHSVFVKEHIVFLANPTARSNLHFDRDILEAPWMVKYAGGSTRSNPNFTVLPDEFLLTWLPTFLIRHPVLSFPSLYRTVIKREGEQSAAADNFASLLTTVKWSRALYNFYSQRLELLPFSQGESVQWPIILDADDIIAHPKIVALYCEKLDLDPEKLRFTWDQVSSEELSEMNSTHMVMRSTVLHSTGVIKDRTASGLDISNEAEKWKGEFGVAAAEHIEKLVREAMPDYEFLRERRLRVD